MLASINLKNDKPVQIGYNLHIRGLIMSIAKKYGFAVHDNKPNPYSFSPMLNEFQIFGNNLVTEDETIVFEFTANDPNFVNDFVNELKNKKIRLGNYSYQVDSTNIIEVEYSNIKSFKTISPIRLTDNKSNFLIPTDSDFDAVFENNLLKKVKLTKPDYVQTKKFQIKKGLGFSFGKVSNSSGKDKSKIGYTTGISDFSFELDCDTEMIQAGIECGFGTKTSIGFGYTQFIFR